MQYLCELGHTKCHAKDMMIPRPVDPSYDKMGEKDYFYHYSMLVY